MRIKGLLSLLLCAALLPVAAACGVTETYANDAEMQRVTNVYSAQIIKMPDNYSPYSEEAVCALGRIYIRCISASNGENNKEIIYSVDENGDNPETMPLSVSDIVSLTDFTIDSEGNYCLLYQMYDENTMNRGYIFRKITHSGEELLSFDPSGTVPTSGDIYGTYIGKILLDGEDNCYFVSDSAVAVVSSDGTKLYNVDFEAGFEAVFAVGGIVYAGSRDSSGKLRYRAFDAAAEGISKELALPDVPNGAFLCFGEDGNCYIKDGVGVYVYNIGDTEPVKLLDWINSDINPNSGNQLTVINADKFVYFGYDAVTYEPYTAILTRVPDEKVKEKYIIELACYYTDSELINRAVSFNRTNENYRVVVTNYINDDNYAQSAQTLADDMISGEAPDILAFNGLDADLYISKDIFVDLYEYLDSENSALRCKDMLGCALTPFEYEGKLPRLVANFYISTVAGKTANIGEASSWTIADMLALNGSLSDGQSLFEVFTKNTMLDILFKTGYTEYIDFEKGVCSFDSEAFISLLEYCASLPDDDNGSDDNSADKYAPLRDDKVILSRVWLYSFADYLRLKFSYGGEPVNLIGYPTGSGGGSIVEANASYGIIKNSTVKEGAWKFLCYIMSDECLITGTETDICNFPATASAFEKAGEYEKEKYYFFKYSGQWANSDEPFGYDGYTSESGIETRLDTSDIERLKEYFNSLTGSRPINDELKAIITEEAVSYFAGAKTAAQAASIIQSRAAVYISEHM